ncbi:hypothetical protein B7P43_G14091 [Cryptotermes secundus]|uniref:Calpain catalytic domain-containing protein n=1 Tax=Cryptotermes secundus TaxID=105785 RepID=A0A2J7PBP3_9NEOP|nr:hypothetical protein B7P43_G14091 [Cryptotermes secundus]
MEIVDNPELFVKGASRFDVQQGELGDCWLLAAVANLTLNKALFSQVVPDDQSFEDKYAGIFHFRYVKQCVVVCTRFGLHEDDNVIWTTLRQDVTDTATWFWQYGRWVDVVIDDRLPTYRGRLVFLHSSEHNEFWSALLEKAYAKSYICETGRPLAVRIREHRHNLKKGLLEKSRLAQHAYEEGHRVSWIFEVESNSRYRKYKESAHMACSTNPISQPGLDISPIWIPLINEEVNKSKMLHGSYEALRGGTTCEAMVDFTGGVTENYELSQAPRNMYRIMLKAYERSSLMGCSIEPDPNVVEAQTPEGLIKGHAYSVTKVKYVDIKTQHRSRKIPLIRIRNPWGNEAEWNGPWSDKSPEWRVIPDKEKEEIGLTFDEDGEFWMSYKDFQKHFSRLEICNLNPDSLTEEELLRSHKRKWEMSMFECEWVRGVTAGGCRNYLETFWHNPQYRITLEDPDEEDDDDKCTVIVALMQKIHRSQRKMGTELLTIGFAMYHLKDPDNLPKPLDLNFFKYNASVERSPFTNQREVSCRFKLPPGVYCIVPSTFEPKEEGEFILRVFSEHKNNME